MAIIESKVKKIFLTILLAFVFIGLMTIKLFSGQKGINSENQAKAQFAPRCWTTPPPSCVACDGCNS